MGDQLKELLKTMLKRADAVCIVLLLALLAGAGYLHYYEGNAQISPPNIGAPPPWDRKIPSDDYDKVEQSFINVESDISEDEEVRPVIQTPMFDLKTAAATEEYRRQRDLREKILEASEMADQKDYDGALEKIAEILESYPGNIRALELKERVEELKAGAAEAAAEPPPPPPGEEIPPPM